MNMHAMYTTLTTFYNKLTVYKHMMVMGTGQSTDACAGAVHVTYVSVYNGKNFGCAAKTHW